MTPLNIDPPPGYWSYKTDTGDIFVNIQVHGPGNHYVDVSVSRRQNDFYIGHAAILLTKFENGNLSESCIRFTDLLGTDCHPWENMRIGTLLVNTVVAFYRHFAIDESKVQLSGHVYHPNGDSKEHIQRRIHFWRRFGLIGDDGDACFSGYTLKDLKIVMGELPLNGELPSVVYPSECQYFPATKQVKSHDPKQ